MEKCLELHSDEDIDVQDCDPTVEGQCWAFIQIPDPEHDAEYMIQSLEDGSTLQFDFSASGGSRLDVRALDEADPTDISATFYISDDAFFTPTTNRRTRKGRL